MVPLIGLLALLALPAAPAFGQAAAPAPALTAPPPPYEAQLQRLAEILGALHYLRTLCGSGEAAALRREMQALLDAESATGERRERLTLSFNRGYGGFELTHRTCTPAARVASRRYADEGQRIIADITSRYAN